jgi:DNA-binding winged helix-turn-helix (wHTH) protein/Tol biopolymer transport system component
MASPPRESPRLHFDAFEVNPQTGKLLKEGIPIKLSPQPFKVLLLLLEQPGEVVDREKIRQHLWGDSTFVDFERGINFAINQIRGALSDDAEKPRYIETLPKIGYRFVSTVSKDGFNDLSQIRAVSPAHVYEWPPRQDAVSALHHLPENDSGKPTRKRLLYLLTAIAAGVITIAIFETARWFSRSHTFELANLHITKVTDSGGATGVAMSPDGRYIAYSLTQGDGEDLRLRQVSTGSDVEIVTIGPGFHGLTFSPNSNYIYFIRSDPNEPYFKYLYSVPMLGGPVRKIITDVDSPVAFSPDGRQFAFERAVLRRNVIELRIANADGSGEHVLTTIQNGDAGLFQPGPSWSHDGRTIACPFRILGSEIRWILAAVSVPGGTVREIYADAAALGRPVWLSGHQLLVPRYDPEYERGQLWTISYPDGDARRFTNDVTDYDSPLDVTGDGKTVAAVASTMVANIWESPAENLSRSKQLTFGQLPMSDVVGTAAGRILSLGDDGRVWTIKPNGQRDAFGDLHDVRWIGACGDLILFASYDANAVGLNRLIDDHAGLLKLFNGDLAYPGCSPDGKFAYYVNRHRPQKVWRISTEGGLPVAIADSMGEGITSFLDVSSDGALLAFTFDQYHPPAWKLAVIPASGGPAIHTFDVPGGTTRVHWAPGDTRLQYIVTQDGVSNIWEQPLAGGNPKQLTQFTSGKIFGFEWSSDRRMLLLTRGDVTSDVVLLSNPR